MNIVVVVIIIDIIFKRNSVFCFFRILSMEWIGLGILVFKLLFWVIYRWIRELIWWDCLRFFVFVKVWLLNFYVLELLIIVLFGVGEK